MIGKVLVLVNSEEITEAISYKETNGFGDIPEPIYDYRMLLFDLDDVGLGYITKDKDIRILLHGEYFDLRWDEELWLRLMKKFNIDGKKREIE